jgi:predicted transposase/invertase (TIGR01784 family)
MFYWAGLYHGQLTSGQKFSDLRKTVVINVLAFDWFQDKERCHRAFHVRDDETGDLLSDDLEVHFLELEKVKRVRRRPKDALESWMVYLSNLEGEELEAIAMDNPGIRKALTIEQAFWQSKKERRLYELREKAIRDEVSALAGAMAEGEARGRQEAICKYLDARFGDSSKGLQKKVKQVGKLETLDEIINKIYTASSLEEARAVVDGAAK